MKAVETALAQRSADRDMAVSFNSDNKSRSSFSSASESSSGAAFFRRQRENVAQSFVSRLVHKCIFVDALTDEITFAAHTTTVVLAFVDISGYSKLASALAVKGAHALADAVNGYFTPILRLIVAGGGDVLKFAGDALMAVWRPSADTDVAAAEACCNAVQCCLDIQEQHGDHIVPEANNTRLRLHIGLSFGTIQAEVFAPVTGQKLCMQRANFFCSGDVLKGIDAIVDNAAPGMVCVSDGLRVAAGGFLHTVKVDGIDEEVFRVIRTDHVKAVVGTSAAADAPVDEEGGSEVDLDLSRSESDGGEVDTATMPHINELFVPPAIVAKLRIGMPSHHMAEMRKLYIFFIKKNGTMANVDWFDEVFEILNNGRCPITQIIEDDKGVHVIAALNLFVMEDGGADAAVALAQTLESRRVSAIVGLATGPCFCGVVGNDEVGRWDITGNAVVRACRLMQYAEANGLIAAVDLSVKEDCLDASQLELHSREVTIKGTPDPIPVFSISKSGSHMLSLISAVNQGAYCEPFRREERTRLGEKVFAPTAAPCAAALVVGTAGSGKKTLLLSSVDKNDADCVPILHRTPRDATRLSLCASITEWYRHHDDPTLRALAEAASEAHRLGYACNTSALVQELVTASINGGYRVAVVVDRTQYLDEPSLRLVADTIRTDRTASGSDGAGRRQGRWLWLFSLTPLMSGVTAHKVQTVIPKVTTVHLDRMADADVIALWQFHAVWKYEPGIAAFYNEKCGGVPGVLVKLNAHHGPKFFRRYMAYLAGEVAPNEVYMQVCSDGYFRVSDAGLDLVHHMLFFDVSETMCHALLQFSDVLSPHQQIALRVIACMSQYGGVCPVSLVCDVTAALMRKITPEMTLRVLLTLQEVRLLRVEHDTAECPGRCWFLSPALQEVIAKTLTPHQTEAVAAKAAKLFDKDVTGRYARHCAYSRHFVHLGVLYYRGQLHDDAYRTLSEGWAKHPHCAAPLPETEWPLNLEESLEHYLAGVIAALGMDVNRVANGKRIPTRHVHRPLKSAEDLPSAVARAKNCDVPLILGPMQGMLNRLQRLQAVHWAKLHGGDLSGACADVDPAMYMNFVRRFHQVIPMLATGATEPLTFDEESDLIHTMCADFDDVASAHKILERIMAYIGGMIDARSDRVKAFAGYAKHYHSTAPIETLTRPHIGLLKAYEQLENVSTATQNDPASHDAMKAALVILAVHGWSSPYQYHNATQLRDVWLNQWLNPLEIKGLLLMYLLLEETGDITITTAKTLAMVPMTGAQVKALQDKSPDE